MPLRVAGWDAALHDVLTGHRREPFKYGVSDCFILAMDAVKAITGHDPYENARTYTARRGSLRVLKNRGFANLQEAMEKVFPSCQRAEVMRGDLAIVDVNGDLALAIVIGNTLIGKGESGQMQLPLAAATVFFRVGH